MGEIRTYYQQKPKKENQVEFGKEHGLVFYYISERRNPSTTRIAHTQDQRAGMFPVQSEWEERGGTHHTSSKADQKTHQSMKATRINMYLRTCLCASILFCMCLMNSVHVWVDVLTQWSHPLTTDYSRPCYQIPTGGLQPEICLLVLKLYVNAYTKTVHGRHVLLRSRFECLNKKEQNEDKGDRGMEKWSSLPKGHTARCWKRAENWAKPPHSWFIAPLWVFP